MNIKLLATITTLGIVSLSSFASAQSGGGHPAGPPFAKIAQELGVSEATVKSCFGKPGGDMQKGGKPPSGQHKGQHKKAGGNQKGGPKKGGKQKGGRQGGPNMAKAVSCLQKSNPSLSEASINKVMEDNRPPRPRN